VCEAIVVCDQSYLAVVLGILEWNQIEKYERRKKIMKKKSVLIIIIIIILTQLFLTVHIVRCWMWEVLRVAGGEATTNCLELLWVSSQQTDI